MRKTFFLLMIAAALLCGGCSGDGGEDLYRTAQFEKQQNNREHARQLYRRVMAENPGSEYAKQAEERLSELEKK